MTEVYRNMDKHRIRKVLISLIVVITVVFCFQAQNKKKDKIETMLSREEYFEIANVVAESQGITLDNWDIKFDEQNKMWLDNLAEMKTERTIFYIRNKWLLKGKCYQAIYYIPNKVVMAGLSFVFIDKETGEVIGFAGGI